MAAPSETAHARLAATLSHLSPPSLLHGPLHPPLRSLTLSALLDEQVVLHPTKEAIVIPWTGARWTFSRLAEESTCLAAGLLSLGVRHGDRIAIMSGNSEQYIATIFAAARIGAVAVVLNNTYTVQELDHALRHTDTKVLFITELIGKHSNRPWLDAPPALPALTHTILLRGSYNGLPTYNALLNHAARVPYATLLQAAALVQPHDLANLQFTSGSTGAPKAAMLSHYNITNNARFIASRMALGERDILCCPPPLFHCFGLVLGLLTIMSVGGSIIFPSETFDAAAVRRAIEAENPTALHGVPAMFTSLLALPESVSFTSSLRTGIIAGAPVPQSLMRELEGRLGMKEYTSSYGLTEASPTCFNAYTHTPLRKRLETVGKIMPHISAKIINPATGTMVPVGEKGELCIAGYALQIGYWRNAEKTDEAMREDAEGVRWLHTGDEATFDHEGYCRITGRYKDIVIRGGENVYPGEVEERVVGMKGVRAAQVVGVRSERLGEELVCFVELDGAGEGEKMRVLPQEVGGLAAQGEEGTAGVGEKEVREWCGKVLARWKVPRWVFFVKEGEWPVTASGKVLKPELRKRAEVLVTERQKVTGETR